MRHSTPPTRPVTHSTSCMGPEPGKRFYPREGLTDGGRRRRAGAPRPHGGPVPDGRGNSWGDVLTVLLMSLAQDYALTDTDKPERYMFRAQPAPVSHQ